MFPSGISGVLPVALIALSLAGCVSSRALPGQQPFVSRELTSVPFFPQQRDQCGPAALATVLHASGAPVLPQELRSQVYLPDRRGSLQAEIVAASRQFGRIPYRLKPEIGAVLDEITAGRPVLVLQNLGLRRFPIWHYAVVVGFDSAKNQLILRSGTKRRLQTSLHRFIRSWRAAGNWSVVLLRPDELPANPDSENYLRAVAGLEEKGFYLESAAAYRTALEIWPGHPTALFGLANSLSAQGGYRVAIELYRQLLKQRPHDPLVGNNLSLTLSAMGCPHDGLAQVERVFASGKIAPEIRRELVATRREILADLFAAGGDAVDCEFGLTR